MGRKALVVHVVGARPNYMKIAPLYAELERRGVVEQKLVHTGQHYDREVNDVFFDELPLPQPHAMLSVGSGLHGEQTAAALVGLERLFAEWRPDLVIVPGDVNSTLAGALAAAKLHIPVCHLEAGLRSFDPTMPEEHNRRLTDHLSSLLLTHSQNANENLANEGIAADLVELVGNTMIDTLLASIERARDLAAWREYGLQEGVYVLVTLHRPRLVDDPTLIEKTVGALEQVERLGSAARAGDAAASVYAVRLAPGRRSGDRDRLRRDSGRVDGPRSPLLHAAGQHRTAGDRDTRHQRDSRPRSCAHRRDSRAVEAAAR